MRLLNFPVLHYQSITLASIIAEDGSAVERKIQSFGEFAGWITQEADLRLSALGWQTSPLQWQVLEFGGNWGFDWIYP